MMETFGAMLPALIVRVTVVLVLGVAAMALLRRASAASRHAVLAIAVVALLALPVLTFVLPRLDVPILPAAAAPVWPESSSAGIADVGDPEPIAFAAARAPLAVSGGASAPAPLSLASVLGTVWLAGTGAALLQIAVSAWLVRRIARRARVVRDDHWLRWLAAAAVHAGVRRSVELVMSPSVAVPVVWGYVRSVVMLPRDADEWPADRAQAFLLHELAHVRRHDCLLLMLANVARALYWPHPLAWWVVRRLRREAERAADDRVLEAGASAPEYAHHLLEAARGFQHASRPLAVLAVAERGSLEDRLLALLDPGLRRGALTPRALAFSAVLGAAAAICIAAVHPVARALAVQAATPAAPAAATPSTRPAARPVPTARPTPEAATHDKTSSVSGVVRADGKPVAGVLVIAWPEPTPVSPLEPAAVRTDGRGEFRFSPPRPAPSYRIWVQAPGFARYVADGVRPAAFLQVALKRGVTLSGRVLDETSRAPVSGARVRARLFDHPWTPPAHEPDAGYVVASSDDEGHYRLEGMEPAVYRVSARGDHHSEAEVEATGGGTAPDLWLAPGGAIAGVVTDADGAAVPRASVVAFKVLPPTGPASPAVTDAKGRYLLAGLEPGTYRLVAAGARVPPTALADIRVDTGRTTAVDMAASRPYRIEGRLVQEGAPTAGRVQVQELEGVAPPHSIAARLATVAGEDGRFGISDVPAGPLSLAVDVAGHPGQRHDVVVGGKDAVFDVGDITVEEGLSIVGRVRDQEGRGVADAAMTANLHGRFVRTRTGADGHFRFGGLAAGRHRVTVRAPGYAALPQDIEAGRKSIEIVLEKAGVITAAVVDEQGRPVSTASLRVEADPPVPGTSAGTERADAGGRVRVDHLVAHHYTVRVAADGFLLHSVPKVRVDWGQTVDLGTITLRRGGGLRGVVVDTHGETVGGAEVSASGEGLMMFTPNSFSGGRRTVKSGMDGAFAMTGLPAGVFKLVAGHRNYATSAAVDARVDPAGDAFVARLVLRAGGRIIGTARRRDGGPATDAFVTVRSDVFDSAPRAAVDAEGRFALERVPPGRCEVVLAVGQGGVWRSVFSRETDVRDGETSTMDLLVSDVRVSGRVTRGERPLPNVVVELNSGRGMFTMGRGPTVAQAPQMLHGVTDTEGRYSLVVPVAGTYSISLSGQPGPAGAPKPREVVIPEAESHRLDITVPASVFSGVVTGADTSQPLERAVVRAADHKGAPSGRTTTRADGRFELPLDPGSYKVYVEAPSYVADEGAIEVTAGRPLERTFRLTRGGAMKVHVSSSAGTAAAETMVVAASEDGRVVRGARTDHNGHANIGGLTTGVYTVLAGSASHGFALQAGVDAGASPVALTLSPPVKARIAFRDAEGKSHGQAPILLEVAAVGGRTVANPGIVSYSHAMETDAQGMIEAAVPQGVVDLIGYTRDRKWRGTARLGGRPGETAVLVLRPLR